MLVTDQSSAVRAVAVAAIVKVGDRESSRILRTRFAAEPDSKVKRAIALGLGKLGDADALDLLTAALRDPHSDEPLRDATIEAVEMIGSKKASTALGALLGQKSLSSDRKPRVIAALGRLKDQSSVKPLLGPPKSTSPRGPVSRDRRLGRCCQRRKEAIAGRCGKGPSTVHRRHRN